MNRLAALCLPAILASLASTAPAQEVLLFTELDGDQAGITTAMWGEATFTLDTQANTLDYFLHHTGVAWPDVEINSAIRGPAAPGQVGQLLFSLPGGEFQFGAFQYPEAWESWFLDGLAYVTIGTTQHPTGELRGQICNSSVISCTCPLVAGPPCANEDADAGCANASGSGSYITLRGLPSISIDTVALSARNLSPNQPAMFFMGGLPISSPFGDGLRCVGGSVYRFRMRVADATGVLSEGPGIVQQSISFGSLGWITSGSQWLFQCWYRDPNGPCGSGTNLSHAVSLRFTP